MVVRIMTWNIHGSLGADGRHDPERVARVIEELRPDVIGLQEVGAFSGPAGTDPAGTLSRLTGLPAVFGATVERSGLAYGNCILSRHRVAATRTYDLSVTGREPRGCLRADIVLGENGAMHLFNCHLGLHWRERRRQASQLLSADILRDTALAYPLVLVGDFNAWSSRAAVPRWLRRQLTDCAVASRSEGPTFPSAFPLLRLDRAYVDAAVRVLGCSVHDGRLARTASDHLPVVIEVALSPLARKPPPARPIKTAEVTTTLR